MSLTFFHANKNNSGSLAGLSINSKTGELYVSIVKQSFYSPETHTGSFKGDRLNVKFNFMEVGALMNAVDKNVIYNTVHVSNFGGNRQATSIFFSPYPKDGEQKGFSLSVSKKNDATGQSQNFSIGFSFAELKVLYEYFRFFLHRHFAALYAADKESFKEREGKKALKPVAQKPVTQETTTTAPDVSSTTQESTPSGDDIF